MIGLKGLPGVHGGVERHVEELSARLVSRGHKVTAYCRPRYTSDRTPVRGIRVRLLPTIHTKHLDATIHSFLAAWHCVFGRTELVHFHGIGPAAFSVIPRLLGKRVVCTIHSHDYLRSKWGRFARWALAVAERIALRTSHRVICVSRAMAAEFSHLDNVRYIPNGVPNPTPVPHGVFLEKLGLNGDDYLIYVGRISPEKGPHTLLQAFAMIRGNLRLVMAGGSSHVTDYERKVRDLAKKDPRVVMTGYLDPRQMAELYTNARGFVLASEHEGLPMALMEAMSYGCPAVCTDIPAAREVGTAFDGTPLVIFARGRTSDALRTAIEKLLADPDGSRRIGLLGRDHVLRHYRWDAIARETEIVYREAVNGRGHPNPASEEFECPVCGKTRKVVEHSNGRGVRLECASCGAVVPRPRPRRLMGLRLW